MFQTIFTFYVGYLFIYIVSSEMMKKTINVNHIINAAVRVDGSICGLDDVLRFEQRVDFL